MEVYAHYLNCSSLDETVNDSFKIGGIIDHFVETVASAFKTAAASTSKLIASQPIAACHYLADPLVADAAKHIAAGNEHTGVRVG